MSNLSIWGISPKTFNDALNLCKDIAKSDFVPSSKQNKPMDCLLAIQYAHEVGLTPMCGLQNIHVVNGVPTLSAKAMLALAKKHPDYISCEETIQGEGEGMQAVCKLQRKNETLHISIFSVKDACLAKLWGKGAWVTYPKRMLKARARSNAVSDVFPDALCGLISMEEAVDYPTNSKESESIVQESKVIEAQIMPEKIALEEKSLLKFDAAALEKAINYLKQNPSRVDKLIERIKSEYDLPISQEDELLKRANEYADTESAKDGDQKNV